MSLLHRLLSVGFLVAMNFWVIAEQEAEPDFTSSEVAPGLYMLMGVNGFTGGNIGLSVGDDGVVMIDDSMPPYLDKMNKAIKSVTGKSIDFLINTHVHGDHIGNNEAMAKAGAYIVAHDNLRTHLKNRGVWAKDKMVPAAKGALPVITFSHSMDFHLNGENAHIFHVENAHTDGDAVIYFKNANVIHTGDTFFNGMYPFIDLDAGGTVEGYIKAQQKMLSISNDKTKIIPGHGPLASKQDLQAAVDMLIAAKKAVAKLIKKGKSEDQAVEAKPLDKFHEKWNWQFITSEKMTRQIYQGLSGSQ